MENKEQGQQVAAGHESNREDLQKVQIALPSVGRIVHLFNNGCMDHLEFEANGPEKLPGIVTQVFGTLKANMQVFTVDTFKPVVQLWSVSHKSEAMEGQPYWDWPERV